MISSRGSGNQNRIGFMQVKWITSIEFVESYERTFAGEGATTSPTPAGPRSGHARPERDEPMVASWDHGMQVLEVIDGSGDGIYHHLR
jgi:hypothetical protein